MDSKERNERLIAELKEDVRDKNASLNTLQITLQGKTEALEKSIGRNKGIEREAYDAKAQLELFKRELNDKNSQMYLQAEKILKLQESEKELKVVKAELKEATEKLGENKKMMAGLKDKINVLNGDVASERRRRITVSTNHAPSSQNQKGGSSSASLKTNILNEVIKEEAENQFAFTEERTRSKSLAPWTGLESPPSEVELTSNLSKVTKLLGAGGTSLRALSSLSQNPRVSPSPSANKNDDPNTLQSLQSVDGQLTSRSLTQTPPPLKPHGLSKKVQAKLMIPIKPPKIVERKTAAVKVLTFPRLPTSSDTSMLNQMRQDLRQMGFTQETLYDLPFKEDGVTTLPDAGRIEKKMLPMRTMSLATLQPYEEKEASKMLPVFPKLAPKQIKTRRVDKMKKISRQEYLEEKRSLGSYDKQALASLLDPSLFHTEKAHFVLLDKSNPNYKPITRPKGGYLEDAVGEKKGSDYRSLSAPRGVNFNFDAESYRLNDIGPIKTLQTHPSRTILRTNLITENGVEDNSNNSGSIENTSHDKITVAKAKTMNQLLPQSQSQPQKSGRNSERSLSPEGKILDAIEFNHAQAEKSDKIGLLTDKDVEALYNFMRSDVNNAGQKVGLLKRVLGQNKEEKEFGDPLLQMEDQLRDLLVLKNREIFKSSLQEWLQSHAACGKSCHHLKQFYKQSGFTLKGSDKKPIKPTTAQFSKMT